MNGPWELTEGEDIDDPGSGLYEIYEFKKRPLRGSDERVIIFSGPITIWIYDSDLS
jgi:hypothetical protein